MRPNGILLGFVLAALTSISDIRGAAADDNQNYAELENREKIFENIMCKSSLNLC